MRSEGKAERKNAVGFLTDDRRLNVALTRAKYQIICIGNFQWMANLPDGKAGSMKNLVQDALKRKCVRPFPQTIKMHSEHSTEMRNKKRKSSSLLSDSGLGSRKVQFEVDRPTSEDDRMHFCSAQATSASSGTRSTTHETHFVAKIKKNDDLVECISSNDRCAGGHEAISGDLIESKDLYVLGKTKSMAVFEDFSF